VDRIGRSQLVVYAAVGIALLIVGARWLGSAGDSSAASAASDTHYSAGQGGSGGFSSGMDGEDVVVDVTGAVADSGVYRLPSGSRVDDAVRRAGGATARANLDSLNLAAKLTDGQQVVVPEAAPAGTASTAAAAVAGSDPASSDAPISIGSATVEQLDTIEGIGPVTAQDIIDFRDERGGVSSVDQLDQISGIGPATMEALRARLQP
jgi:competence protein ComEA